MRAALRGVVIRRNALPCGFLVAAALAIVACSGDGARVAPGGVALAPSLHAAGAHMRPLARSLPPPQSLCVGGSNYTTAQDDEFSKDKQLDYITDDFIRMTPAPNGALWSAKALGFANGGTRNNIGIDDAFYTNDTIAPGYNPFSIGNGALGITAVPIPSPIATSPAYDGAHWFSGVLAGPALTYGYVEVSAAIPNLQGWWPAPIWLLGYAGNDGKGNGYEELDGAEIFGNSLGKSVVQQTEVFAPTGLRDYVRWYVTPDPSKAFHTYGILWTPATVSYYIDRQPTSMSFPNGANGPANPLINLQVFSASYGIAPPPANNAPQTMSLHYYRWYQKTGASCSPTVLNTPPPAFPTPTPEPNATPVPGAPYISGDSGVVSYPQPATFAATLPHLPQPGDTLVAVIVSTSVVTLPPGFGPVDVPNGLSGFGVFGGIVGSNGIAPATTYGFGTTAGALELLDISGGSTKMPGIVAPDPGQSLTSLERSLRIPAARGLLLSVWAGASDVPAGFNGIAEQLPAHQFERILSYSMNNPAPAGTIAIRLSQVDGDPFTAPQPYSVTGTAGVFGNWLFDGDLIWVRPAH